MDVIKDAIMLAGIVLVYCFVPLGLIKDQVKKPSDLLPTVMLVILLASIFIVITGVTREFFWVSRCLAAAIILITDLIWVLDKDLRLIRPQAPPAQATGWKAGWKYFYFLIKREFQPELTGTERKIIEAKVYIVGVVIWTSAMILMFSVKNTWIFLVSYTIIAIGFSFGCIKKSKEMEFRIN